LDYLVYRVRSQKGVSLVSGCGRTIKREAYFWHNGEVWRELPPKEEERICIGVPSATYLPDFYGAKGRLCMECVIREGVKW
jgi:hypothetical protein